MRDRITEVSNLFNDWNAAIQTGDPDRVVSLYAFNGILIPTLSNDVRSSHAEIRAYFVEFLKKQPRATLSESYVRAYGDTGFNSGIYAFTFGSDTTPTYARYTYSYQWHGDRWLIVEHHSSLLYKEHPQLQKGLVVDNFIIGVN
jgi:uncharacterized protein (TIGR02246 family)